MEPGPAFALDPAAPFATREASPNSFEVAMGIDWVHGFERWVLLTADRHWDNPKSDHALQLKHLEQARERRAPVVDIGDFFCVMQGRADTRHSKNDVRPEHAGADYLDRVVNTAAEFFAPHAEQFAVVGFGNHESKVYKHQETDLQSRFLYRLKAEAGLPQTAAPLAGGYGFWVTFRFRPRSGSRSTSVRLKAFHGSGGGGPVTKGVIQTNRRATYLPDAHIVATGHIHEQWALRLSRERINRAGRIYLDEQLHVQVPTYKEEYQTGHHGWHVERGAPPKPVGATWLRFYVDASRDTRDPVLRYETTPAR